MINSFQDIQNVSKVEMSGYMQAMGEWNKNWQAIATEVTDYSKRLFEESMATFQKLAAATSVPEAMEIQTTYVKQAYEDYMDQMSRIGAMYQSIATDAFKPSNPPTRDRDSFRRPRGPIGMGSEQRLGERPPLLFNLGNWQRPLMPCEPRRKRNILDGC